MERRECVLSISFLEPSTVLGIVGAYQLFDVEGQEAHRVIVLFFVICREIFYYCHRILLFQMPTAVPEKWDE